MNRRTMLATFGVLAALLAGLSIVLKEGGGGDPATPQATAPTRLGVDPHGDVGWKPGERQALLNAVKRVQRTSPADELAAEGRELFRSDVLAKQGESCNGCHTDGGANSRVGLTPHRDNPPVPNIASDFTGDREPIALYRVAKTAPYFWHGKVDANGEPVTLEQIVVETILNHFADGATQAPAITSAQAARITAYLGTIDAPESPFSQGTMSDAAQRGLAIFQGKAGCVACHIGPEFTDNEPDNVLSLRKPGETDTGVRPPAPGNTNCPTTVSALAALNDPIVCAFDTPSLLGVGHTAPYFHNGFHPTLESVVSFYNTQSVLAPLGLSAAEQADLVAFLKSI